VWLTGLPPTVPPPAAAHLIVRKLRSRRWGDYRIGMALFLPAAVSLVAVS
jgi:hypothetical protein